MVICTSLFSCLSFARVLLVFCWLSWYLGDANQHYIQELVILIFRDLDANQHYIQESVSIKVRVRYLESTWQPAMISEMNAFDYWVNWRFFMCAIVVLFPMIVASIFDSEIWRFRCYKTWQWRDPARNHWCFVWGWVLETLFERNPSCLAPEFPHPSFFHAPGIAHHQSCYPWGRHILLPYAVSQCYILVLSFFYYHKFSFIL